jgi:transcriptional regulator with XRE-family HTH domain
VARLCKDAPGLLARAGLPGPASQAISWRRQAHPFRRMSQRRPRMRFGGNIRDRQARDPMTLKGITMAKTKGPNPIDIHVGSRMRMRRIARGMSQEKLARALGLTFQQVQKYEKGANRMGSSRLQHAADVLGVAAASFFEGAGGELYQPDGTEPSPAYIADFVGSEEGLRLAKAFMRLRPAIRRRIVDLVNEVAGESGSSSAP